MNLLEIQNVSTSKKIPAVEKFQFWMDALLKKYPVTAEVVIRIVDEVEMAQFNLQYRGKQGPTNILSFAYEGPEHLGGKLLGDLLVCAPVVEREALLQHKQLEHHWAHMIVHGVLHLLGYDHVGDSDAKEMESLEIKILNAIKIDNPYQEEIRT